MTTTAKCSTGSRTQARIVRRGSTIIGAIFPDRFSLRIVRVPYHDPDRDGMSNGHTHTIRLDASCAAFDRIESALNSPYDGHQGRVEYLQHLLERAVGEYNADAPPDWPQITRRLLGVIDQLMPGIGGIACRDYQEINEAPIDARKALRRIDA